jgi:ABC-type nitrate/sulfonate/bicarbonate transport system substrate-binding protein
MNMSRLSKHIRAGICALALAATAPAAWAQAVDAIKEGNVIGAMGALRTSLPEVAAASRLKFDIKDFGDSSAALRALDQGELDIAVTTAQHLVRALTEGMDVVWVVGGDGGNNVLVAKKTLNLPVKDTAALKKLVEDRKKAGNPVAIAVPTGSLQHVKLVTFLKQAQIDADKDVRVVNVGFPNHPRALEAGEVDLAMTLAPFGVLAMEQGNATLVEHLFGGAYGKQEIGFIVSRKLLNSNPDLVQRMVDAHVAAMRLFVGDKDKQIVYEKKYSRFPANVVERTEREFIEYAWQTNTDDIKLMAKEMKALGWAPKDVSDQVDNAVDLRFLSKATGQPVDALKKW